MLFTNLASTSRLSSILPRFSRSLVNRAALRPVPPQRGIDLVRSATEHKLTFSLLDTEHITTPHDFLTAVGRSSETKLSIEAWEDFWKTSGQDMKKLGLAVRDRRYVLTRGRSTRMMLNELDTFYGAWRNIAVESRFRSLRTNRNRRRQCEGKRPDSWLNSYAQNVKTPFQLGTSSAERKADTFSKDQGETLKR